MLDRFFLLFMLLCRFDEAFRVGHTLRWHRESYSFKNGRPTNELYSAPSSGEDGSKAFLEECSLWRLNFKLKKEGENDVDFYLRVRFIEQKGYEPPQGKIFIEDDISGVVKVDENGYSGVWTLSEDKDDRKDGLWIWGLFEEPKYPFLYFNMDLYNTTILPSGEEEPIFGGEGIPNGRLYMRCSHTRDKNRGVILSNPQMTWKLTDIVSADLLGIVKFDAGEFEDAGELDIFPQFSKVANGTYAASR